MTSATQKIKTAQKEESRWLRGLDETALLARAKQLALVCQAPLTLHLVGDLGAGKTTFSRGFIQALGHEGAVKSPTYTLVEPYELPPWQVYHFDLYRLSDAEELEYMGIRDYFNDQSVCLIEWPERGAGRLPTADIEIQLINPNNGSLRDIQVQAFTKQGEQVLGAWFESLA